MKSHNAMNDLFNCPNQWTHLINHLIETLATTPGRPDTQTGRHRKDQQPAASQQTKRLPSPHYLRRHPHTAIPCGHHGGQ